MCLYIYINIYIHIYQMSELYVNNICHCIYHTCQSQDWNAWRWNDIYHINVTPAGSIVIKCTMKKFYVWSDILHLYFALESFPTEMTVRVERPLRSTCSWPCERTKNVTGLNFSGIEFNDSVWHHLCVYIYVFINYLTLTSLFIWPAE